MLDDSPNTDNKGAAAEPEDINQDTKKKSLKKPTIVIIGLILVIAFAIAGWFLTWNDQPPATKSNDSQSTKETDVSKIKTYEECLKSKGHTVAENSCTAADGAVFFGIPPSQGNTADETSTDEVADQSVTFHIGPQGENPPNDPDAPGLVGVEETVMGSKRTVWRSSMPSGQTTKKLVVFVTAKNVDLDTCTLTVSTVPDKPGVAPSQYTVTPKALQYLEFIDGLHTLTLKCPSKQGPQLTVEQYLNMGDQQPELCKGFSYSEPHSSSAATTSELRSAMNGTWSGCVSSPWWPDYHVAVTFNQDGTYNASSDEQLDGLTSEGGFYFWNSAGASPSKTFDITSLSDGAGQGYLYVIRPEGGTVQRGTIENLKLKDDLLTFDYRLGSTLPIHFMLHR